jgi:hypothetical protein
MPVDLELSPKQKRAAGERCCEPVVYPDVRRDHALRMAEVAKGLRLRPGSTTPQEYVPGGDRRGR